MNKNKLVYLSPKTETLVIRFGGNVMNQASPLYGTNRDTFTEYLNGGAIDDGYEEL